MKHHFCLALACSVAGLSSRADIVIEGVVTLPPPKAASAAQARYQQKSGVVAAPESPLAVVYLEGTFANAAAAAPAKESVPQKGFQFTRGLVPVQKGTEVEFPNGDDDYHHVFSYSKTKEFDLGRYRKDEKAPSVRFDKPGVVRVGCEIHDHMRAVVLVLDTPHFARTEADGKYRLVIKEPVSGRFVLKAWVNERTVREQPVELKQGATLQVNFP